MNVKHFFSIHHNDLGLFLVQCYTYYRQYKHKCVVKYLRILFLYSEHTNTRSNYLFIFPQKQCTQCTSHSQPTQSCTYTTYKTTEEFTVYSVESMHQLWDSLAHSYIAILWLFLNCIQMAPCRPASSWEDFCARHGPVLISLPYQYFETCHCFLLFFFVFAVMLWHFLVF